MDFEKKIKSPCGTDAKLKSVQTEVEAAEAPGEPREAGGEACPGLEALAWLEPLTLPCVLAANGPEEQRLAQALSGLQLAEGPEDSARLKRSFSLDIKSYGELGGGGGGGVGGGGGGGGGGSGGGSGAPHRIFAPQGDAPEYFKPSAFKEPASKPCQFSPVEEVSEQSTPEQSPDKEQADGPSAPSATAPPQHSVNGNTTSAKEPGAKPAKLLRSSSREENNSAQAASFLLGLSHSQQHLARPGAGGCTLKGWHSDILLGPVTVSTSSLAGGWYLSSDPTCFYSTSAILSGGGGGGNVGNGGGSFAAYSCSQGLEAVRRRGRQKSGDRGDSRRSWHEESTFEKQLKRRSCQMEFGGGMLESRSREEMGKVGSQTSFSGSMEIIEVS